MVNPGGESTMLGQWRIVLRQAEEAARLGRYEEAYALATRPGVADHHHAVQFRSRLALDLIARATRRGGVDDLAGADRRPGSGRADRGTARLAGRGSVNLADRVADEVRADLDAGEPARVLERVEELARHKIGGPALRRAREIAEAWQNGLAEGRRGEFGRAQSNSTGPTVWRPVPGPSRPSRPSPRPSSSLRTARKGLLPRLRRSTRRCSEGKWPQILSAAEAVLTSVPEHPGGASGSISGLAADRGDRSSSGAMAPARGSRSAPAPPVIRHLKRIPSPPVRAGCRRSGRRHRLAQRRLCNRAGGFADSAAADQKTGADPWLPGLGASAWPVAPRPLARVEAAGPKGRFLLWVDAVGGYLVCLDDRILLGRAGPDSHADIPLMGDLSRNHATLLRNGEGYLLQAHHRVVHQRQAGAGPGRAARRRRDPAGLDRRAGIPPAQSGQCDGAALDREPASASAGGGWCHFDGRNVYRRE